jgi:hypothetical protein
MMWLQRCTAWRLQVAVYQCADHAAAAAAAAATGECATKGSGLAVVPRKGDALLFWDMHVDGTTVDRAALHASCPTLQVGRRAPFGVRRAQQGCQTGMLTLGMHS